MKLEQGTFFLFTKYEVQRVACQGTAQNDQFKGKEENACNDFSLHAHSETNSRLIA